MQDIKHRHRYFFLLSTFLLLPAIFGSSDLLALPIGFHHNQGQLDYKEIVNEKSIVYHDARSSNEARLISTSIEQAMPILESWIGKKRDRVLPVITTSVARGASFANFVTDTIELQTMGQGTRDLTWHELTHTMTYTHLHNIFGPAGAIIHLIWMPTWFLEGFAEAMSVSEGSDMQAGYERFHALTNSWPTFERLHSLYNVGNIAVQGYNTSGAWVAYLLRAYEPTKISTLLQTFYENSMPWWWPWAAMPFSPFLPFDSALEDLTTKKSRELWDEYKSNATAYWRKHQKGPLLYQKPGARRLFRLFQRFEGDGKSLQIPFIENDRKTTKTVLFDESSGWALDYTTADSASVSAEHITSIMVGRLQLVATQKIQESGQVPGFQMQVIGEQADPAPTVYKSSGQLVKLGKGKSHIYWLERQQETFRFCKIAMKALEDSAQEDLHSCPLIWKQPDIVTLLGTRRTKDGQVDEIWINVATQTIRGDRHQVVVLNPDSNQAKRVFTPSHGGRPIGVAFAGSNIWQITAEKNRRAIRNIDRNGRCLRNYRLEDTPYAIYGFDNGSIALGLLSGTSSTLLKLNPKELPWEPCYFAEAHTSPLLEAMRSAQDISFKQALDKSSLWGTRAKSANSIASSIQKTEPLGTQLNKTLRIADAQWRPRPVFGVPWIAADALGYNYGVLSVPLMDHMQNETIRMTSLWGWESRYPSTQISFKTTRFAADVTLNAFRYQSWNGVYENSDGNLLSSYVDEKGADISFSYIEPRTQTLLTSTVKSSVIAPYMGPIARQGHLRQFGLGLSKRSTFGPYAWISQVNGVIAPDSLNKNFDFNKISFSSKLIHRFTWRGTQLSLGVSGGRTRGSKRRLLQEVYRPLKTFIPGSGGGFNNVNMPIVGQGGLFQGHFGDTKLRTSLNLAFPLIESLDTLVRVLYLQSLEFSAFVNYGATWNGSELPAMSDWIGAHGYNLDLLMDIKGVNFNLGLGTGQVFHREVEVYATFGFDAIL